MIPIVLALVAIAGLVFLARSEGTLLAEIDPQDPSGGGTEEVPATGESVPHELVRFAASVLSVLGGGAFAVALVELLPHRLVLVPVALFIAVLLAVVLTRSELAVSRRMLPRSTPPDAPAPSGAFSLASGMVRGLGRLGERLATLASVKDDEADEDAASEQFSRVLSSETDMSKDEEKLLRGAISLPRITVRDVMVPRLAVVGVETGAPWSEMLDRVRSSEHSRLPAFRQSLDDVTGVIVAKDLLPFALEEQGPPGGWERLVRPVSFVPATKAVADQLRQFRDSRTHMAIVVDEYGGSAGILTIEDVLEELVGEIRDEHDVEEPPVIAEGVNHFWVLGRVPLDQLDEIVGETIDKGLATTVGGLVFERIGRVPKVGEELVWGNFRVVVERMKRHAVDRVYLERTPRLRRTERE